MCKRLLYLLTLLVAMPWICLGVNAQGEDRYDAAKEGVVSGYYCVDHQKGYITGIAPGTPASTLLAVCLPAGAVASDETLATGTVITFPDERVMTAIVAGDLNGDGAVTITDFLKIKAYILGQSQIVPTPGQNRVPMLLLTPGQTAPWGGGAAYGSGEEAIASVDENGNIHAQTQGSAFVYAYDAQGSLTDRILVTVLDEPLSISFGQDSLRLVKDTTHTLEPVFNHPVSASVTWDSSDPAIVSVENGLLQGLAYGSATVTAALDNGNRAQIQVTVTPALTSLSVERKLYKVKPNAEKALGLVMEPARGGEEILWSSSDSNIATVTDGVVTGHKYGTVTVTATGKYSGLTATCQVKVCNVKQVAFTFDDGPSSQTTKLLNFLRDNDIRVTFFLVGNRITSFENTVLREMQEGHEIGYHSYDHQNQTRLSDAVIKSYFQKSDELLRQITGQGFTLWRTPGGNFDQRVLDCVPLPHILWSVDSQDWVSRNSAAVYRAIRNCPDGSIVLMHDLYSFTVNGAIQAMTEMQAGDYEFLTVTELLSRDGTPPEPSVNYRKG